MTMRHIFYKALLTAVLLVSGILPTTVFAAGPDYQGLGLPGPVTQTQIQMDELRIVYRFDQMGQRGKAQDAVPVQATYKFHNPGPTQTLDVAVPLPLANGKQAELTSVYVNGKEIRPSATRNVVLSGSGEGVNAAVVPVTVFENSDLILDLRINQPVEKLMFPFDLKTGSSWNGTIQNGTFEAIMPYDAANWNLSLRKRGDDAMLPLAYSGRSANWSFVNLKPEASNDVYWTIADPSAMEYYMRGNQRYQQTQGDAESYAMMRNALLDMVPCGDVALPLSSWWSNVYDTVTTGLIVAQFPEGMDRLSRSMEIWSDNWNVPHGTDAACQAMRQRPDRYRQALKALLAIPKDQLSAQANTALANHYRFLRNLAVANVSGTKLTAGDTDPLGDANLSDIDRQTLSQWDDRFAVSGVAQDGKNTIGGSATTFWNKIKAAFPKLSLRTQIAIFVILALLVLVGIALIAFGWKEKEEPTWSGTKPKDGTGSSVFMPGPQAKPLYDRPTSISGANFAKPVEPKKLDETYTDQQSGLGSGFKKPDTPTTVSTSTAKPLTPPTPAPKPNVNVPSTEQPTAPTQPKAPPSTKPSVPPPISPSNMPWEQPVKLDPIANQKTVPPPTAKIFPNNQQSGKNAPSNTNPNQSEHKNGPTIKI